MQRVNAGDWVTLYYREGEVYTVRVEPEKVFHTTRGYVNLSSLIGLRPGTVIETNIGEKFVVTKATFIDRLMSLRRFTQVIYPKDLGYMLLSSGIGPGSIVAEAGTGTGFLAATLAYYVRPDGKVYTYEVRRDFYEKALENFQALGLLPYIIAKNRDVKEGFEEKELDAVLLDLPDPWLVAEKAYEALANGGILLVFVPTVTQVERTIPALRKVGFRRLEVIELIQRKYKAEPSELRPETIGVQHTGYVVQGQKL